MYVNLGRIIKILPLLVEESHITLSMSRSRCNILLFFISL